jgi:ATP-dependent RNA helicase DDX47/RRP3
MCFFLRRLRYDVELYQKIEQLIGKKLPEYPAEQETVLTLLERVGEAQRMATMQARNLLRLLSPLRP